MVFYKDYHNPSKFFHWLIKQYQYFLLVPLQSWKKSAIGTEKNHGLSSRSNSWRHRFHWLVIGSLCTFLICKLKWMIFGKLKKRRYPSLSYLNRGPFFSKSTFKRTRLSAFFLRLLNNFFHFLCEVLKLEFQTHLMTSLNAPKMYLFHECNLICRPRVVLGKKNTLKFFMLHEHAFEGIWFLWKISAIPLLPHLTIPYIADSLRTVPFSSGIA